MKQHILIVLLCAVMLLAACAKSTGSATDAPRAGAPTSPTQAPTLPPANKPVTPPVEEPVTPPVEDTAPMVPPVEDPVTPPVVPPVEEPPSEEPQPVIPPVEDPQPVDPPVEQPVETPEPVVPPVETPPPAEPPIEQPHPVDPPAEDPIGEHPLITIESYDEYLVYLATADLPATFVPYETISALGEFDHFVCLSNGRIGDYSHYMYTLVDETGMELILYVEYHRNGPELTPLPIIDDIDPGNMRKTLSSQRGRYLYEGIEYKYISTGLLSITWEDQGHIFTLFADGLGSYPDRTDTLAGKMMDLSQAKEALSAIELPEERN